MRRVQAQDKEEYRRLYRRWQQRGGHLHGLPPLKPPETGGVGPERGGGMSSAPVPPAPTFVIVTNNTVPALHCLIEDCEHAQEGQGFALGIDLALHAIEEHQAQLHIVNGEPQFHLRVEPDQSYLDGLSYRQVQQIAASRGLAVAHVKRVDLVAALMGGEDASTDG